MSAFVRENLWRSAWKSWFTVALTSASGTRKVTPRCTWLSSTTGILASSSCSFGKATTWTSTDLTVTAKVDTDHTVSAHQTCTSVGVLFFDKGFLLVCFWVGVFCSHALSLLCFMFSFFNFLATVQHSTVQLASAVLLLFLCVCFLGGGCCWWGERWKAVTWCNQDVSDFAEWFLSCWALSLCTRFVDLHPVARPH